MNLAEFEHEEAVLEIHTLHKVATTIVFYLLYDRGLVPFCPTRNPRPRPR